MEGNLVYILLTIAYVGEGITAFTNTKRKERYMIEEGEAPLPRSSYVFLGINYLLRIAIAISLIFIIPTSLQLNVTGIALFTLMVFAVPFIARIIEVVIRTAIVRYVQKQYIKQLEERKGKRETS